MKLSLFVTVLAALAVAGGVTGTADAADHRLRAPFEVLRGDDMGMIEFVSLTLRNRCAEQAGFPQFTQTMPYTRPVDPFTFRHVTAATFGRTSEEEAHRLGFGFDAPAQPPPLWTRNAAFLAVAERCDAEAWEGIGPGARAAYDAYFELANRLMPYRAEVDARIPVPLRAAVLDCLNRYGYDVPDRDAYLANPRVDAFGVPFGHHEPRPGEDWQPDVDRPDDIQIGPALGPARYVPTLGEQRFAVAFFRCGESTGRVRITMRIAVEVQREYVHRFHAELAAQNPVIRRLARSAAALL